LVQINGTEDLVGLIERVFDPEEFAHSKELSASAAVEDFNSYLRRDGLEVSNTPMGAKLRTLSGASVSFVTPPAFRPASQEFISEHISKCELKLREGDFAGAITNARSLCEEVLCDLQRQLDGETTRYDGGLPKLYKNVRKKLKMEPEQYSERQDVAQLIRGLASVVDGLSGMSNLLGDRHGGTGARPKPHHAHLAVNAANTLCSFMLASFSMQRG
jgi:hypothetical protein